MKKAILILACSGVALFAAAALLFIGRANAAPEWQSGPVLVEQDVQKIYLPRFSVDVLVNGRSLSKYDANGRSYVEAVAGAEYEVRLSNPLPFRVAVALSVDGLNTIDARRTTAWNASKWVIEPYNSITIGGWQMSSARARRFYFTTERDSYGAKLGQTANLGVISAVFFRERRPIPLPIVTPPRTSSLPEERKSEAGDGTPSASASGRRADKDRGRQPYPDDEAAATGIGRSVQNDVTWIDMDLDPRTAGEVTIRYEYRSGLVRLGIIPLPYAGPDSLRRRERATGFEDRRFSPEP